MIRHRRLLKHDFLVAECHIRPLQLACPGRSVGRDDLADFHLDLGILRIECQGLCRSLVHGARPVMREHGCVEQSPVKLTFTVSPDHTEVGIEILFGNILGREYRAHGSQSPVQDGHSRVTARRNTQFPQEQTVLGCFTPREFDHHRGRLDAFGHEGHLLRDVHERRFHGERGQPILLTVVRLDQQHDRKTRGRL